jgi:hypothetical protein
LFINIQFSLKSQGILGLVGSSVDGLTCLLLGSVLHFLSLLGSSVCSILGGTLDSVTGSTDG